MNLYELGLCCSKQLAKQKSKVNHKGHVTYGARAKRMLKMFALICKCQVSEHCRILRHCIATSAY
jgi:hypothetical protein